jgi:DMSO/TMAO reductase YedYZ heme-binding membrane subunit
VMAKIPWHLRNIPKLAYLALLVVTLGIAISSALDSSDPAHAWIVARELYGLWALALLLAAMLAGPLIFVLPWLPFKGHLLLGRRALGISAFALAVAHVASYLGPVLTRDWHDLYYPGRLWLAGLLIGFATFADLAVLAFTSRRRAIRSLGAAKWKRWHKSVYTLLPLALLHAIFVGADFGVNKGPDVTAEADAGCLVAMLLISLAWLFLFMLRKRRIRWIPSIFQKSK